MDNFKISHVDQSVNTSIIDKLIGVLGNHSDIRVTRGGVYYYLGMTLDYTAKGVIMFQMFTTLTP